MEERCQPEHQRRGFRELRAELYQNDMPIDGDRIITRCRAGPETRLGELQLVLGGQQTGVRPHLEPRMRPRIRDDLVADAVQRLLPVLRVERPGPGLHPDPHPGVVADTRDVQRVVGVEPASRPVVLHLVDDDGAGRIGEAGRILLHHRSGHVFDGLLGRGVVQPELPAVRPSHVQRLEHVVGFTRRDERPPQVRSVEPFPHRRGVSTADPVGDGVRRGPELMRFQAETCQGFLSVAALGFRTRPHNHMTALRRPLLRRRFLFNPRRASSLAFRRRFTNGVRTDRHSDPVRGNRIRCCLGEVPGGEALKYLITRISPTTAVQQRPEGSDDDSVVELDEHLGPPLLRVGALDDRAVCQRVADLGEHRRDGAVGAVGPGERVQEVDPVVPAQANVGTVVRRRADITVRNRCHRIPPPPPQRRHHHGLPRLCRNVSVVPTTAMSVSGTGAHHPDAGHRVSRRPAATGHDRSAAPGRQAPVQGSLR